MRVFAFSTLVGGLFLLVTLTSCGQYHVPLIPVCYDEKNHQVPCCGEYPDTYACQEDAGSDADIDGGTTDASETDASDDGEADAGTDDGGPPAAVCPWPCTPTGGAGFDPFPSYVWIGNDDSSSPPPPLAGFPWRSWIDVKFAEPTCTACSCAAPTNPSDGCLLPAVWSVESTVCQDPSSSDVISFDPPLNWAGSCASTNPITEGMGCNGEPCVKSLVLQPPTIAPCVVAPAMPPEGQTLPTPEHRPVLEYVSASTGQTCGLTSNCIVPAPTGYQLCFVANDIDGDLTCPEGWTDRHTGWREVDDARVCSACSCSEPEGASCEVHASVYADDGCVNERASIVLPSTEGAKCVDLPAGTALGSKTAEVISYQAGTCAPSTSEVVGEINVSRPVTYCCLPPLPISN